MFCLRVGILIGACMMSTVGLAMASPPVAVPIPATEVLFGLGFAALAWIGPKIRKRG